MLGALYMVVGATSMSWSGSYQAANGGAGETLVHAGPSLSAALFFTYFYIIYENIQKHTNRKRNTKNILYRVSQ